MNIFLHKQRQKGSLSKDLKIWPGELYYRLALELNKYKRQEIDLKAYYEASKEISEAKRKLEISYALLVTALYFSYIGILDHIEIGGLGVKRTAINILVISLMPAVGIAYATAFAKFNRYSILFGKIFNSATGPVKQDLILRYPSMYNSLYYNTWMTGAPRYMVHKKSVPRRVVIILAAMIPGLFIYAAFVIWLLYQTYIQIWASDPAGIGVWSKVIVIVSILFSLVGLIFPTITVSRVTFHHYGLLTLLSAIEKRDPNRYRYFVSRAFAAQRSMNLSAEEIADPEVSEKE